MDAKVLGLYVLLLATLGLVNSTYQPRNFKRSSIQSLLHHVDFKDDREVFNYLYHLNIDQNSWRYSSWVPSRLKGNPLFGDQLEQSLRHRHHKFENHKSNDDSKSFGRVTPGFKFLDAYNLDENLLKRDPATPVMNNYDLEFTSTSNTDTDVSLKSSDALKPESNLPSKKNQRISNSKILSTLLVQDITTSIPISNLKLLPKTIEATGKKILDEKTNLSIAEKLTMKMNQNISSELTFPPEDKEIQNTTIPDVTSDSSSSGEEKDTTLTIVSNTDSTTGSSSSGEEVHTTINPDLTTDSSSSGGEMQTTINPDLPTDSTTGSSSSGEEIQTTINPDSTTGSSSSGEEILTTINPDLITDSSSSQETTESTNEPTSSTDSIFSSSNSVPVSSTREGKLTDKTTIFVTSDSTDTGTSKEDHQTETIPPDHVIRIASIRKARVIISVVFIVIALVAASVLAVYMFRIKRRAPEYDQLLLLR